jgi:spermidine synthase
VLGALPAFMHPAPRSAALIGLGSGDTLFAIAGRPDLERITSIEIVRPQLTTLREADRRQIYPGLTRWLQDPRIDHVFGDGRLHVRRAGRTYDIIEADALRPSSAYSGNLYSDAYFSLLLDHLAPGGLAVTWAPTPRIWRTFLKVFPYVWQHGTIMIGSNAPIVFDAADVRRRISDPAVREYYASATIDIDRLLGPYLTGGRAFDPSHDRSGLVDLNTDLFPRDEFALPGVRTQ